MVHPPPGARRSMRLVGSAVIDGKKPYVACSVPSSATATWPWPGRITSEARSSGVDHVPVAGW